jgi:transposase
MDSKATARTRAEMIVKVRAGLLTAQAAADALGVSRKTYYEWEKKGLQAMLGQLEDQEPGRPPSGPSPEEEALAKQVQALETKLAAVQQTAEIRAVLRLMEQNAAKKKRK